MPNEWQNVLDEIKNNISEMAFNTYFNNFDFIKSENDTVYISVPNVFIKNQIEKKYISAISDALTAANFTFEKIEIELGSSNKSVVKRAVEVLSTNTDQVISTTYKTPASNTVKYGGKSHFSTNENGLNPKYRLDNYVVGSNNDLAVSAAYAVIENPGERYNPYFIYGGPGLGKTHLIQAIGNEIVERYPKKKVLYVTIEQFYSDFVEAMRKKIDGFSEKYRNIDVLIVDDFQFIQGKEKSQDEFFHTFNELHQHNKQIIVSSDRLPSQIATVDERLASRLSMGMQIDIQMPNFEERCAILKAKAEMIGRELDDETVEFLANNIKTNVRDLEGKLNQVLALSELRGVSPNQIVSDNYMDSSALSPTRKTVSARVLIDRVSKFYDLSSKDLLGTSRIKNIKTARQIAMYLMNKELNMSTVSIGREFDKDHTTIMHGIRQIDNNLKTDFNLREQISTLREKIYL